MTQKNSKVKIYLTEFRVQGENTIYEGPNIFPSSSEIAENIAEQMGVTVVGELQDIISLYDDLYEIFDKDVRVLH